MTDNGESVAPHEVDDGYCIAECPHGQPSPPCGLQVVRPGKFQCWCDGLSDEAAASLFGRSGTEQ